MPPKKQPSEPIITSAQLLPFGAYHRRAAPAYPITAFNERCHAARVAAQLGLPTVVELVAERTGQRVSRESVRRLENGYFTEDRADPFLLLALADIYDVALADLSPLHARHLDGIAGMVERVKSRRPRRASANPRTSLRSVKRQAGGSTSRWTTALASAGRFPHGPSNRSDPAHPPSLLRPAS